MQQQQPWVKLSMSSGLPCHAMRMHAVAAAAAALLFWSSQKHQWSPSEAGPGYTSWCITYEWLLDPFLGVSFDLGSLVEARKVEARGTARFPGLSLGRQFVHKNKFIFIFSLIIYLFIYLFIWLFIYLFMYLFIIIFFSIISFSIHLFIALFMYLFKLLGHQSFELSSVGGGQPITEGRYCSKF